MSSNILIAKKKIVICRSTPIFPDPRVEKLAKVLVKEGHHVQIIGWDRTTTLPSEVTGDGYSIKRIKIAADFGRELSNIPSLIIWQAKLFKWLLSNHKKYDVIHSCDLDTVFPALLCRWLFRKKLIYDIFDFYSDRLQKTPVLLKRIIKKIELAVINTVDIVILTDENRKNQIHGSTPKEVVVIYNTPEDKIKGAKYKNAFLPENSKLKIAYVGILQEERGLINICDVLEQHRNWELELAGFGRDEKIILERAKQLMNVNWHGRVSYKRALEIYADADVLLALYSPVIANHAYASPNKLFEAMMLGKPVIVASGTSVDTLIKKHECGLVIEYGNFAELEKALILLNNDIEFRKRLGRNGRQAYEEYYSWARMEKRIKKLYGNI